MGLEFNYGAPADDGETFEITERLAETKDGRLVPEESPEARWLFATPGTRIPMEEAIRRGLASEAPDPAPTPKRRRKRNAEAA